MNSQEFVHLIHPFKDKVYRLAKRLLVSAEEAEDATQEVMMRLWKKNEILQQYNSVEALAMTITKNYCLDQLKSKRASQLTIAHNQYADKQAGVLRHIEANDDLQWIERGLNFLPEQQKLIIQLREVEQYEFSEIAEILDMNETAIRVALSRGRKAIREYMTKTHQYGISSN
ncbi:MAG: RNA polymerase sigma factor [Flavobacteriaceae bacterium]